MVFDSRISGSNGSSHKCSKKWAVKSEQQFHNLDSIKYKICCHYEEDKHLSQNCIGESSLIVILSGELLPWVQAIFTKYQFSHFLKFCTTV